MNIALNMSNPSCLLCCFVQHPGYEIGYWTTVHRFRKAEKTFISLFRYVGENYSNAQETMEDTMYSFYSQSSTHHPLSNPVLGQLVAIRGENGDELARAQVVEVMAPNKVKVT